MNNVINESIMLILPIRPIEETKNPIIVKNTYIPIVYNGLFIVVFSA